ncbi:MAG: hypothetical protein CM15mP98_10230 [Paracoccaceae bacterium]|nr:MAG: hypothetical protein CM15mP98_10230 [Paracoccaceae bacterium]
MFWEGTPLPPFGPTPPFAFERAYNDSLKPLPFMIPQKAKALLKEAGVSGGNPTFLSHRGARGA